MRVICCIIELYVVFIGVSKKRSFNGRQYLRKIRNSKRTKMKGY